jgi:hypothetical protein
MDQREETGRGLTPRRPEERGRRSVPPDERPGTPDAYPVATPPGLRADDHSWVLQTVMELQKSNGALTQAVKTLTERTSAHGEKLDSISHRLYAATAVLVVIGGGLAFVIERMWDKLVQILGALASLQPGP